MFLLMSGTNNFARAIAVRRSCDCLTTFARTSLSLIYSQCCHDVSHLCRNWFAIQSYLSRKYVLFQNDCDLIARGRRHVRDGFETPAMTLRPICEEFYRIKFLNVFKIFATTLRHLATHARKLRITGDCFETALRPTRDVCRQLSQNSRSPVR